MNTETQTDELAAKPEEETKELVAAEAQAE